MYKVEIVNFTKGCDKSYVEELLNKYFKEGYTLDKLELKNGISIWILVFKRNY